MKRNVCPDYIRRLEKEEEEEEEGRAAAIQRRAATSSGGGIHESDFFIEVIIDELKRENAGLQVSYLSTKFVCVCVSVRAEYSTCDCKTRFKESTDDARRAAEEGGRERERDGRGEREAGREVGEGASKSADASRKLRRRNAG